jgi:hypothetical protein
MFNVHVFHHRFPALATAVFASLALAFVAIAGTTCSFLNVVANDGRFVEFTTGVEQEAITSSSFGVLCETYYFDSDGDTMWNISKAFLYVSLALGGLAMALAWIVTWCIPPTNRSWRILSVISALTAVLNIPVFLLFESEPCTLDNSRQKCTLSFGSFLLMSGTVSSIAVVLLTQCIDPPRWGSELDAWKVEKRERGEARGVVASDEYSGSENNNPEDPENAAPPVKADDAGAAAAGTVATVGFLEGLRRWRERQKWSQSSDLKQNGTGSSSQDDEEIVPFAGAGSYYANSSNSRLLLKVTPEGKRPDDEQDSAVSFGDLDEYVKMVEEGKLNETPSTAGSLEEFAENEAVRDDTALLVLSQDESEPKKPPKTLSTATTNGQESFTDEPQFYSEMKPPPSLKEDQALLDKDENESLEDEAARESKISRGIRSLTSAIRDSSRRTKSGKTYTMMDSDDEASGVYSSPPNRPEEFDADTGTDNATDEGSSSQVRSAADTDHLHHQTLLFDWNALHAAANAGILLAREDSLSDPNSTDEDDPAQISYTSDDSFGPGSNSSLGNLPDDEEEDDNSVFSGSTISDISDKDDDDDMVLGDGVAARKERKRSPRKSPRKMRRDYSSAHSVSSYTSVLDMTIDEETDLDLKEFESSEDDKDRNNISSGYKSAPETLGADRKLSPYAFIQSESLPASGERGYIVPKASSVDKSAAGSNDSSEAGELMTPDTTHSQVSTGTPETVNEALDESAYYSDGSVGRGRKAGSATPDEEDEGRLCFRRSRSMSAPRKRKSASVHPLVTPPLSPVTLSMTGEKTRLPWREERLLKGGIHSESSHIISDSETSEEKYLSEASAKSAKSSMSRRARKARIRRLQSQSSTNQRQRSKTLDPPKNRHRGYDRQLSDLGNPSLQRALFGNDHGPDEASM